MSCVADLPLMKHTRHAHTLCSLEKVKEGGKEEELGVCDERMYSIVCVRCTLLWKFTRL